jgi:predicted aminopeptidase
VDTPQTAATRTNTGLADFGVSFNRTLLKHGSETTRAQYRDIGQRRQDFRELNLHWCDTLEQLYASGLANAAKAELLAQLLAKHALMKQQRWGGFAGYDLWFASVNNAALGVLVAYSERVADFARLFAQQAGDFERFYAEVARIGALPKAQRHAKLRAIP